MRLDDLGLFSGGVSRQIRVDRIIQVDDVYVEGRKSSHHWDDGHNNDGHLSVINNRRIPIWRPSFSLTSFVQDVIPSIRSKEGGKSNGYNGMVKCQIYKVIDFSSLVYSRPPPSLYRGIEE